MAKRRGTKNIDEKIKQRKGIGKGVNISLGLLYKLFLQWVEFPRIKGIKNSKVT